MKAALPSASARVLIAGVPVDALTRQEAARWVLDRARAGGPPAYVVTPNAHHVALLRESSRFRRAYADAALSVADGISLVWASRVLGRPLPERVAGVDLFEDVCAAAAGGGIRVFLLGGRPAAAEEAARVLRRQYPGLEVAGTHCPPFGFENDPAEAERVAQAVRAAAPHVLFVALGAPKQEVWLQDNLPSLGVPVGVGVGAAFDFVSGQVRRAPRWMRRAGLEWLFRVMVEPRRLWKRYAVYNTRFIALVFRQRLRGRGEGG
ncbi:MAG: WecB/TagA/CpsF family glycosyltransferase [Gemmatimonadetes bacterium]|nr:WecB/TagA/CpsF family glycosyltransferase [Gemmatimonadota bacterium]